MSLFSFKFWANTTLTLLSLSILSIPATAQNKVVKVEGPAVSTVKESLTEVDRRKLNFFADSIVMDLDALVKAEKAGDTSNAIRKIKGLERLSSRFNGVAENIGLSPEETTEYFLNYFLSNFHGEVPSVLVGENGSFDVKPLLSGELKTVSKTPLKRDDYISQLRIERLKEAD